MAIKNWKYLPLVATLSISGVLLAATLKVYDLTKVRKSIYNSGIANYKEGKCKTALKSFERLETESTFMNKIDNLSDGLGKYRTECNAWIATTNNVEQARKDDNLAQIPLYYLDFIKKYSDSDINEVAKQNNVELLDQVSAEHFADTNSCTQIDSFESYGLFLDRHLPYFNLGCIQAHREDSNQEQEFGFQTRFLTEYPEHDEVLTVKQGMLLNSLVCINLEQLQGNETAYLWGNFIPVVYLACGKAYQEVMNYDEAIFYYQSVEDNYYLEDELVSQAQSYLTSIDVELDQISMEMSYAADVIAGRITVCSVGKIWLSPIFTGGEVLTGKDCMTGKSLSLFERIIKAIPISSQAETISNLDKLWEIVDTVFAITKVHNVYNSIEKRQELMNFLGNEEEMQLLKDNNPDLATLVDNIDNTFDMNIHYQEVVEFLN